MAAALVDVPGDDLGFAKRSAENRDEIDTFEVAAAIGAREQPFAPRGVDSLTQVGSQFLGNRDAVLGPPFVPTMGEIVELPEVGGPAPPVRAPRRLTGTSPDVSPRT